MLLYVLHFYCSRYDYHTLIISARYLVIHIQYYVILSNDSLMVKCMQTMGHTNGVCVNETILCNYKITNSTNVLVPSAINVDIGVVERHINPIIDINWSWRYPYYAPQFHMYVWQSYAMNCSVDVFGMCSTHNHNIRYIFFFLPQREEPAPGRTRNTVQAFCRQNMKIESR